MRELRIEVRQADPAYVEQKVGASLYVHLRAVPRNVAVRRQAIERGYRRYTEAIEGGESEALCGGLGLLVLQRAMLAVEDLGGLLFAFEGRPGFDRLVSYRLDDISGIFDRIFNTSAAVEELFGIPTSGAIGAEPGLTDRQRASMLRLREITLRHLGEKLDMLRRFWQVTHYEAKKTMHGVGFLAGCHALESPGAGALSDYVDKGHPRPFAISLTTHIDHVKRHAKTKVGTIDLSEPAVGQICDAGIAACDAMELFVGGRLHGLQTNHAYSLPATYLEELEPADRAEIEPLFAS